jgi:hypothetical protein
MRIYEGNHAYEIERVLDPATQIVKGWRYNIYRVRPRDELLQSGDAPTKEAAEEAGRKALEEVLKTQHRGQNRRSKPAA